MRAGLAALSLLGPLATGCGDDGGPDPAEEATAGVAAVVAERLDVPASDVAVTCPEDLVLDAGARFRCSVAVADADPVELDLAVSATGVVELQRAVVPTRAAEDYLAGELAGPADGAVQVDCGDAPLLVADVGDTLRCDAVRPDGTPHVVAVEVLTLDGTVRYEVQPADPPTTTTVP